MQRLPWRLTSCSFHDPADLSPFITIRYTAEELGHGLRLLQVRAVDGAGNTGPSAEYIWFSDQVPPTATFLNTPSRYTTSSLAEFRFAGAPTAEEDPGASFVDHLGQLHDCRLFRFRVLLDGYDITPRGCPNLFLLSGLCARHWQFCAGVDLKACSLPRVNSAGMSNRIGSAAEHKKIGSFSEDMDDRDEATYNYRNYLSSTDPVLSGEWREYSLMVVPVDTAGLRGAASRFKWTIDHRKPITSITETPGALSGDTSAFFAWVSDEDGESRNRTRRTPASSISALPRTSNFKIVGAPGLQCTRLTNVFFVA